MVHGAKTIWFSLGHPVSWPGLDSHILPLGILGCADHWNSACDGGSVCLLACSATALVRGGEREGGWGGGRGGGRGGGGREREKKWREN